MSNHQFFKRLAEALIAEVTRQSPEGLLFRPRRQGRAPEAWLSGRKALGWRVAQGAAVFL